jgi:Ca-activated chloride channel family protein
MNAIEVVLRDFHFLRPLWLLALLGLPLLVLLWRRLLGGADPWRNVVDAHLLAALREPGPLTRRRGPLLLVLLVFILATLALAGPAWQRLPQPLLRAESALVIALDLSDRMRATDVAPSRLARARFKIADLLRERRDGQVALIAYAGDAFTVAPLTDDAATVLSLLASLDHDTLPEPGQRADRAIREAMTLLANAGFAEGDLLLFTDRAEDRDQRAAADAAAAGLRVSVLGVGTAAGAPIALGGGGFLRDAAGAMLLPRRDDDSLRALAAAGDGGYQPLALDLSDLRALALLDAAGAAANLREDAAVSEQFRDEGGWLLLLMLPLAALLFRRGWLLCVPLVLVLTPPPAAALDFADLWRRADQRAWQALQEEQAAEAQALARDPALRGSAAYRAGDFAAAVENFAQVDSADADYNRGNALARAGKLEEALQAYDEALARDPASADAQFNREQVRKALESEEPSGQDGDSPQDQQKQDGEQPPGEGQPQEGEESGAGQSDAPPSGPADDSGEARPDTEGGDGEDAPSPADQSKADEQAQAEQFGKEMAEALEQGAEPTAPAGAGEQMIPTGAELTAEEREAMEQQQAIEQMLRRVPDDPGGLLRRKFAIEARRRQQEGRENEQ